MGFKMNGSPAKLGTIQGTSGHTSALKHATVDKDSDTYKLKEYKAKKELEALEKQESKDLAKKELKTHKAIEGSKKDGLYVTSGDAWDNLSPEAQNRAIELNKKKIKKREQKKEDERIRESKMSEKTRDLRSKLEGFDKDTELTSIELEKAKKKEGKYGEGLFGGLIKRKKAKRKHKKAIRKEDRTREQLAESEAYDQLTIEQKEAKRREKQAYLTARFNDDARAMYAISQGKEIKANEEENEYDATLPNAPSFTSPSSQSSAFQDFQRRMLLKDRNIGPRKKNESDIDLRQSFRDRYRINVDE